MWYGLRKGLNISHTKLVVTWARGKESSTGALAVLSGHGPPVQWELWALYTISILCSWSETLAQTAKPRASPNITPILCSQLDYGVLQCKLTLQCCKPHLTLMLLPKCESTGEWRIYHTAPAHSFQCHSNTQPSLFSYVQIPNPTYV